MGARASFSVGQSAVGRGIGGLFVSSEGGVQPLTVVRGMQGIGMGIGAAAGGFYVRANVGKGTGEELCVEL